MTLANFLANEQWAVYRVDAVKRKYFGDTIFGPMWKDFPQDVEIPEGIKLDSLVEVMRYANTIIFLRSHYGTS